MFTAIYCSPLNIVLCPYIYQYQYINMNMDSDAGTPALMRGKHSKVKNKSKYGVGIQEVLNIIACHNPQLLSELLKCGIPFTNARDILKKMINMSLEDSNISYKKYKEIPTFFCNYYF